MRTLIKFLGAMIVFALIVYSPYIIGYIKKGKKIMDVKELIECLSYCAEAEKKGSDASCGSCKYEKCPLSTEMIVNVIKSQQSELDELHTCIQYQIDKTYEEMDDE